MVQMQIQARGIRDQRVLEVMQKVPRHFYAEESDLATAYGDFPLPIGNEQTISQPYIVAYMTEVLELEATDRVLEIGTGCGYQTAILAELAASVHTIEIKETLARKAREKLEERGYTNITYRIGDGKFGWPEAGPFDAIMATAAPHTLPPDLIPQLRVGGRLVLPEGSPDQYLVCYTRTESAFFAQKLIAVRFVPLI
ncbi:MAG: protein-L-isoaspartate(D-aspartate) O-methyltransferase [Planctomycetota bacterium]|jgi:protein-L-isoaspartate(D-aspartate) O-methyltransferase